MSVYTIGLTGGIATGKTNISDALRQAGAYVVDADEVSRSLTADNGPALPALLRLFGENVFDSTGENNLRLNRRALGALVFGDAEKLDQLNKLLHPMIISACRDALAKAPGDRAVLSAPLLFECGMESMCHEIWCTYVDEKVQLARLTGRDNLSPEEAMKRIRSQISAKEKARRADHVINTAGTPEESAAHALHLWEGALPPPPPQGVLNTP